MVSKETAEHFMELCAGSHSGHMANIPNNPSLMVFCQAHGLSTSNGFPNRRDFAHFLREASAKLLQDEQF